MGGSNFSRHRRLLALTQRRTILSICYIFGATQVAPAAHSLTLNSFCTVCLPSVDLWTCRLGQLSRAARHVASVCGVVRRKGLAIPRIGLQTDPYGAPRLLLLYSAPG